MNNYNQIDLDKVKLEITKFTSIEDSKNFILEEEVPFNPIIIKRNINETSELLKLLQKDFFISFDGIKNITDLFIKANKNITLNSKELSEILSYHNHLKRIKDLFNQFNEEYSIKDYTDSINLYDELANEITKVVDNNGNIKDDATNKLKEITNSLLNAEKKLYDNAHKFINTHSDSLQETSTYIRNNRVVLLIKSNDKNKFKGYTYGSSSSGLAFYVEPEFLIELNNEKISLEDEREEEINSILTTLTFLVSKYADDYINNFDSILKLNVIYAKAYYGFKNLGILAQIDNESLYLKDICHPLIDPKSVVSNTYTLNKPYKGIVISGTNTGGKTVGLKCIGLSILSTYLGIPIIASEAKIPLFDNVYVDIDDNQSISNSLSTFSAHISNINTILSKATNKSFILIDELISGTDPKEAQAISLAILNKIEKIGSNFVVTTHYDDIKNYAYKNSNILLSSVGFDRENLKPTYKYIENSVGQSNAIEIAERYFDDKEIIDYAKNVLKESMSNEDDLMDKLSKEIEQNQVLRNRYKNEVNDNIKLKVELTTKIKQFENEKLELRRKYINDLNEYVNSIKLQALDKLDSIHEKKQENKVTEIENLIDHSVINDDVESFEVNDNVKVLDNDRIGTIVYLNGNKADVEINGLIIKTTTDNLTKMPKFVKKEIKNEHRTFKTMSHELVLVGKHIDEAIDLLEQYLDDALTCNLSQVKIVHGLGTGQLKLAVRAKLTQLRFIKSFKDGDFHDGGGAVTIVKLK